MDEIINRNEYGLLKDIPSPGDVVVDWCPYRHIYYIWASKHMNQRGKIIAIEPSFLNYKRLLFNIKFNGIKNVIPQRIAISDKEGISKLLLPSSLVSSTLYEEHLLGLSRQFQCNFKVSTIEEVPVNTLDNILSNLNIKEVDILKIDVEGSELYVLKGAKKTLENTKRVIMEVHNTTDLCTTDKIVEELKRNGFIIEGIFETPRPEEVMLYARNYK